jgi:hypothetical protein
MKVFVSDSIIRDGRDFYDWLRQSNWRLVTSHSKTDGKGKDVGASVYETDELSDGEILLLKLQWPIIGAVANDGSVRWSSDDFRWLVKAGYD